MDAKMIHITPGPSVFDPSDSVNLIVDGGGAPVRLTTRLPFRYGGFRGLWGRFLVWGIRNYVRGVK